MQQENRSLALVQDGCRNETLNIELLESASFEVGLPVIGKHFAQTQWFYPKALAGFEPVTDLLSVPCLSDGKRKKCNSAMQEEEEEDAFLAFVESARLMLLQSQIQQQSVDWCADEKEEEAAAAAAAAAAEEEEEEEAMASCPAGGGSPSWGWVCNRIVDCLNAYSSGVTPAILLSDLLKAWLDKSRVERGWKTKESGACLSPGLDLYKKQKQLRTRLSKIVTIDSVYDKKFISIDAVLEVVILNIQLLPGTRSYLLTVGDAWSSSSIDLYLHHKFYDMVDSSNGVLKKGREIRITGCRLRTAVVSGSSQIRLLPTEYLVVLLDEDKDEDALLVGARFCSDTFSDIQLESVKAGTEFCFYARLEKVDEVEIHAQWNHVKQQKLLLSDENKTCIPFVLWDDQISLAGLFSPGSMIALERPFISQVDSGGVPQFILEYGSASCLYTMPFTPNEEQVTLETCTQKKLKSSAKDVHDASFSQLMLPTDSQGAVDYCSFPFRLLVSDIRPKMSNISLYGVVKSFERIEEDKGTPLINLWKLSLQDHLGAIDIRLCFSKEWKGEQLDVGHTVFVSGVTSHIGPANQIEGVWKDKDEMARLVNLTQLPALLRTPCLYQILPLHKLSRHYLGIQVCRVRVKNLKIDQMRSREIDGRYGHSIEKTISDYHCCPSISYEDTVPSVSIVLELYDRYNDIDGQCVASCSGQSATDILQVSAQDFLSWPEDEQALYLYSLHKEEYIVAIYAGTVSLMQNRLSQPLDSPWKIGQALKCE